jgi:hypothetical protein
MPDGRFSLASSSYRRYTASIKARVVLVAEAASTSDTNWGDHKPAVQLQQVVQSR